MYWSVRRELWENRSIYVAPLVAAAVFMFGFAISTICLPDRRRAVLLEPAQQRAAKAYDLAAMMIMLTAILVGVFYCLEALHGERRDRSILFWKSLPVSDRTTVLSKASIPLAVLPLLTFAITLATQLAMLLLSTAVLLMNGLPPTTWSQLPLLQSSLVQLYGLVVLALWHAPIYAWLLLVSGWARRATFLWAVLPSPRRRGEDRARHLAGRVLPRASPGWRSREGVRLRAPRGRRRRIAGPAHSGTVPERPRSLARAPGRRGSPRRRNPPAPPR
jgi:ABC-2 type transport system permease protein